jgi:hypothetical protein
MAKQTHADRVRRLEDGCCPVHGIGMPQVDNVEVEGQHRYLVRCPRKDCGIQGTAAAHDGPVTLTQEHLRLLFETGR